MSDLITLDDNNTFSVPLDKMLMSIKSINDNIQNIINDSIINGANESSRVSSNATIDLIHYEMQGWGSDLKIFNWFGSTSYSYFNFLALCGGLLGWSYTYVETVYKTNMINQLNSLIAQTQTGSYLAAFYDFEFVSRWVKPRIVDAYNKALGFRNTIIQYLNLVDHFSQDNRKLIEDLQKSIASLNTTFNDRVDNLIEVWFDSWYAYWDYWYESQWKTLVDELVKFKDEYDIFYTDVQVIKEIVESQSVDLDDILKKLYTPFSNVFEIKEERKDDYEYQLHLLKELVIEALSLDFPSVRETMLEKSDIILGKRQQENIKENDYYVRQYKSRR